MLDGRVLGASQVEYKPFGKPPLKREVASSKALQHKCHLCSIPGAPPARHRSLQPAKSAPRSGFPGKKFQSSRGGRTAARFFLPMAARPQLPGILKPRQAAEPPLSPGSLLYVLYVLYLTRQAAEPPLSPGFLAICAICAISYTPSRGTSTLPRVLAICTICAIYSVRAKSVLYVLYRAI